jgi:hypothetical protein
MRNLAESLLAVLTSRARAAAIYGDLLEMSATHSRFWFATAYLRTLATLSWRVVAALVVAMSLAQLLGNVLFHAMPAPSGPHLSMLLIFWFDPKFLWFLLPFAVMLFGVRDRFVQLTAIAALGTTFASLFLSRFSLPGVVITLALAASLFLFSGWRKQAAVLAATLAFAFWTAIATGYFSMFLRSHEYIPRYGHGVTGLIPMLTFRGTMLAAAYLCTRLHRRLLQTPNPPCSGAANA